MVRGDYCVFGDGESGSLASLGMTIGQWDGEARAGRVGMTDLKVGHYISREKSRSLASLGMTIWRGSLPRELERVSPSGLRKSVC